MRRVIVHADDFAANIGISKHILDCCGGGALYSVSVLANGGSLPECVRLLRESGANVKTGIHFNLAEGRSLAGREEAMLLTDERGMLSASFFKVLLLSLTPRRAALKKQVKREFKRQLDRYLDVMRAAGFEVRTLRVDSHQHYHMIPAVLEVMLEVVEESGLELEYIRIPAEPLSPFIRHLELYPTYRPINLVKNLVLNALYLADKRRLAPYADKTAVFFGIMLSGRMDLVRVRALMGDFLRIAKRRGLTLELLAHPGGADRDFPDPENKGCVDFYTSKGRRIEKHMIKNLKG